MKHLTLKELPVSERPYEKCEKYGVASLSDAELLAVIIKTGSKGERVNELANRILNYSKGKSGLIGLNYLTLEDFMSIHGIGRVKAIQLLCVTELTKRMAKAHLPESAVLNQPKEIAKHYMQELRHLECEHVVLLLLDTKCHKIKDFVISKGTVNAALAEPREIFLKAVRYGAVNIVLLHNHPSGDVSPSNADISITKRVFQAGELLGIQLVDHIIIGDNRFFSFREKGMISK
ncbi:MAG: DNA repair protein RadC [Lachnospiraceae bacterium]|nr:DNA repair protein RadC [Lachnospiraceae bacterium]